MPRRSILAAGVSVLLCACQSASPSADAPAKTNDATQRGGAGGASPWQQASARGVAFRGVGTEPGWSVEVDRGDTPALRAELDYGARKVLVARAQPLSGVPGYAGRADDGAAVSLRLRREPCSDGMSDASYPAMAELTVAGRTYRGCGRFLAE
jgi:uncharacterized membrane protein